MSNKNRIDAIYARQSVDKKDSIYIESQVEFCRHELKGGTARKSKGMPVYLPPSWIPSPII